MHEQHPRIQVSISLAVKAALDELSSQRQESISHIANELIEKALELEEDIYFSSLGESRLKELAHTTHSHDDVWK